MLGEVHAWIDESVQVHGPERGFYVLAASIADPARSDTVRTALRTLVAGPTKRLHWNAETASTRMRIAATIADLRLDHLAVTAPAEATRQERARRKCLERLLYELDTLGVTRAWLESRQHVLDRRDREMVEAVRGTRLISRSLTVDFARPLDEPMLWIPDAVAGMTTADERTGTTVWSANLGRRYRCIRL